jgi:transposase
MDVTLEMETMKIPKQAFTAEFKELAVNRARAGQSVASLAREPGVIQQTLRNWVTAAKAGKLNSSSATI